MNFSIKWKWTQRRREQVCDCQGEGTVGEGWTGGLGLKDEISYA